MWMGWAWRLRRGEVEERLLSQCGNLDWGLALSNGLTEYRWAPCSCTAFATRSPVGGSAAGKSRKDC